MQMSRFLWLPTAIPQNNLATEITEHKRKVSFQSRKQPQWTTSQKICVTGDLDGVPIGNPSESHVQRIALP